jgi:hypothetical protein
MSIRRCMMPALPGLVFLAVLWGCRSTVQKEANARLSGSPKPSAVSYSPASGSGLQQDFTLVVSDPKGYQAVDVVLGLVSATLAYTSNCQFQYQRAANIITLYSDEKNWLKPVTLGSAGVLDNGLCTIDPKRTTAVGSANDLTLKIPLTFSTNFAGQKALYLLAQEGPYGAPTATSDWQIKGTWFVPDR